MMKRVFKTAIICIILAGLNACKDGSDMPLTKSFKASRTDFQNPDGKAELIDYHKVHWNTSDQVAVYADGASTAIKFTASSDGASTTLSSTTAASGSQFHMVYPYEASKGVSNGKIHFDVPEIQKAYNGTFDPAATVSVACSDNLSEDVVFDNALSLIKFSISERLSGKVHTVIFEARSGEPLCGDILCDPADMSNEMVSGGESHSSVTLKSAPAMTEGSYYISIRPCTMATGFKITAIMYDKTYYTRELTYSYQYKDDFIYNVGEIGSPGWYYTSYDYTVSTVSGVGENRATGGTLVDGSAEQTTWRNPDALAWMPDGRIMAADRGYHYLRTLDPETGKTATWLTSSASSSLKIPWRIKYHGTSLYVANKDTDNIMKITSDKSVSIIDSDFENTNGIMDLDFDDSGNLYVLDRDNNVIYKYAGEDATQRTSYVTLTKPLSMLNISGGRMLVTGQSAMMYLISDDGSVTPLAGNGSNGKSDGTPGNLLSAELGYIYDFTIADDGTIYFTQWNGSLSDQSVTTGSNIRMIVPDAYGNYDYASVVTIAGNDEPGFADGIGAEAKLKRPYGIITTADQSTIYFSDEYNYVIRKIDIVPVTSKVKYEDIY